MFLEFKNLKIKNFLSYKDAFIDLSNKGYCFVSGKNNYKEDNALSNGSGKSTFLQAICWCLTGETISGIKTDLKNLYVDEKETYVELNVLIDGKYYKLIRYYEPKSDLKIYVDGEDKSGKGIRDSKRSGDLQVLVVVEPLENLTVDQAKLLESLKNNTKTVFQDEKIAKYNSIFKKN